MNLLSWRIAPWRRQQACRNPEYRCASLQIDRVQDNPCHRRRSQLVPKIVLHLHRSPNIKNFTTKIQSTQNHKASTIIFEFLKRKVWDILHLVETTHLMGTRVFVWIRWRKQYNIQYRDSAALETHLQWRRWWYLHSHGKEKWGRWVHPPQPPSS